MTQIVYDYGSFRGSGNAQIRLECLLPGMEPDFTSRTLVLATTQNRSPQGRLDRTYDSHTLFFKALLDTLDGNFIDLFV